MVSLAARGAGVEPVCDVQRVGVGLSDRARLIAIYMAFAPYWHPGDAGVWDYALFAGVTGAISMLLVGLTVLRIRVVCTHVRVKKAARPLTSTSRANVWRLLHRQLPRLTPSLDGNPVVWREWHRGRPSSWR